MKIIKRMLTIVQWFFAILLAIGAFGTESAAATIVILLAAVLFAPVKPVRKFLKSKLKINSVIAVILAFVLFFVGIGISPTSNTDTDDSEEYEDLYDEETDAYEFEESSSTTLNTSDPSEETSEETSTEPESTTEETTTPPSNLSSYSLNINDIPAYSNSPYYVVNNNQPSFSSSELTMVAYEKYSPLDSLGRCGVAIASCGKEIMPAAGEERGSISSIKPSGWVQAKYSGISGGYLYNRCHLIGWQLSAENANSRNLITGTRYLNINGMLPFENMVADYIKETSNHVAYRITPIFEGNNLVASGVQMEAYSVEDDGDGICFNVYCYNVQPGVTINYATGSSTGPSAETTTKSQETTTKRVTTTASSDTGSSSSGTVWIPQSGSKYHSSSSCSGMKNPSQVTKSQAEAWGYTACKKCW